MTIKQIKRKIHSTERRAEKVNDELESLKEQLCRLQQQEILNRFGVEVEDEVIIETDKGRIINCQLDENMLFHENGSVSVLYHIPKTYSVGDLYLHEIKSITRK